jgi:16S rRNA (cytosine967-C5)-methyltransferase
VVRDVSRGRFLDRSAERRFADLDGRDRAWAMEAAYGTVRLRGRLDALLAPYVGARDLDPVVRDVLRLGAFQLTEMGGVPDYAAVSESVDLARAVGRSRAAGLVNAVLKRVAAGREDPASSSFPESRGRAGGPQTPGRAAAGGRDGDPDDEPPSRVGDTTAAREGVLRELAERGSHPRWLLERWIGRYGPGATRALVDANNRRPELYLRLIGVGHVEASARLARVGIGSRPTALDPRSLRLDAGVDVVAALAAVPAIVQDPAASAVARHAAVPPGAMVADLCAAPGGKSFALLDLGAGRVAAFDRSAARLEALRRSAVRLGLGERAAPGTLHIAVADATRPALRDADAVLVDVPCTGTGTFRRHPDGRWRVGPDDLASLVRLQTRILKAAATAVAPGGLLVYATCSLEPEENEEQVERFLDQHPDFRLEAPDGADAAGGGASSVLRLVPHVDGADGAFAARLRRHR